MVPFRKDTLAYFKARPLFQLRNMAAMPVAGASQSIRVYEQHLTTQEALVEPAAVEFYFMNHAFAEVSRRYDVNEPLPASVQWVCDNYVMLANALAVRMTYYLLLICTREVRHLKSGPYKTALATKHGEAFANFVKNLPHDSTAAANRLRNSPPDMLLGDYTKALAHTFHKGLYNSSYGGPKWGVIADVLDNFVHGRISAEVMLDTAWTLAHNTSPIFNKGMLWAHYTADLVKILDVQRAGMMPQLLNDIVNGDAKITNVGSYQKTLWEKVADALGEPMKGYVDWARVMKLGAVKQYPKELAAQVQKHGPSPDMAKPDTVMAEKVKATVTPINKFFITPTEWVEVVDRKKAA